MKSNVRIAMASGWFQRLVRRLSLNELVAFPSVAALIRCKPFLSIHVNVIHIENSILGIADQ